MAREASRARAALPCWAHGRPRRAPRRSQGSAARADRAAPRDPRRARARPRAARHAPEGARCARDAPARARDAQDDERGGRHAARRAAGPLDPAARRHGRAADARGHRARRSRRRPRARCTPAATTRTPRCWSARRACSTRAATSCAGDVLFMFQPGEEGFAGARVMLDEGLLDRERAIDAAFALHVAPRIPARPHRVARRARCWPRPTSSTITVTRQGGHASMPHRPRPDAGRVRDRDRAPDAGHARASTPSIPS